MKLLEVIETQGYGITDRMYYVKEEGLGVNGMALLDGMAKVYEMVAKYEQAKCCTITVIKSTCELDADINIATVRIEDQIPISVVYPVDESQQSKADSEYLYMCTQQSNNRKGKQVIVSENRQCSDIFDIDSEEEAEGQYDSEDDGDGHYDADSVEEGDGQYGSGTDEDQEQLNRRIGDLKMKKTQAIHHYEGDTDVEDLFVETDSGSSDDCIPIGTMKKLPVNRGPTSRSHGSSSSKMKPEYISGDDFSEEEQNSDDCIQLPFLLPNGRKSRSKKRKPRVWYDENRLLPGEQMCLQLCFIDVYQFRKAVHIMHIDQLRNFRFHRNCKDRVIVKCVNKKCPFFLVGSKIAGEKTFCIRKMENYHTCTHVGEETKVTCNFVAENCQQALKSDPATRIETVLDSTKEKFGVVPSKHMAYRARKKALKSVIGDELKQYTRLRDYLQTVIDTNPGSRCIVTTKKLLEQPSANPRFHGLFIALGASVQGFLKGCRSFIGKCCVHSNLHHSKLFPNMYLIVSLLYLCRFRWLFC